MDWSNTPKANDAVTRASGVLPTSIISPNERIIVIRKRDTAGHLLELKPLFHEVVTENPTKSEFQSTTIPNLTNSG
jgi:hypothetical protein